MIGSQILCQMSEVYRKLQGTLRYLLANLHDWTILQRFVIVDLSNSYFDVAKDRLYVGGSTSYTWKSCQTVLVAHLLSVMRIIEPILPHLAEDVWQNLPFQYTTEYGSVAEYVFESRWRTLNERWLALPLEEIVFWENILELRTEVNRVLDVARTGKLIGASLDAKVHIYTSDASLASQLCELRAAKNDADALHRLLITSQAEILPSLEDQDIANIPYSCECLIQGKSKVWIGKSMAAASKCERCWNYSQQFGSFLDHPTLCRRCYNVVALQMPSEVVAVG